MFAPTLCFALLFGLVPRSALGESAIEEGQRFYEEADLEHAHQALSRAEASSDLTLDELARLYELRALLHRADGNAASATDALRRLAVVQPEHTFDRSAPPEVVTEFTELSSSASEVIEITTSAEATPTGVEIQADVSGDVLSMVRELRIHGRAGEGPWRTVANSPLEVETTEGRVEYYAEAVGPGGVVLHRASIEEYLVGAIPIEPTPADEGRRRGLWIGLGVGGGALLTALVVVLAVTLGGEGDRILQPTFPTMVED